MARKIFLAILLSLLLPAAWAQQAPRKDADYDAVRDFSIHSNPNGAWSYGYMNGWGSSFTLYTVPDTNCYPGYSFSGWHEEGQCHIPFVLRNDSDTKICFQTFCIPTGYLFVSPGPDNGIPVVRWTVPSSGKYLMQVTLGGLDWAGPTSTGVYVQLNSKTSLLSGPITSYQWPLKITERGSLAAGDTVDFIVDWGKNADYNYDSTGLEVKIWKLGQSD